MEFRYSLKSWAAYAPGLPSPAHWQAWAGAPWLPAGDDAPALAQMPALARRRLTALGRTALQAAYWCRQAPTGMPVVFASRYGDADRSLALLADLARGEPLSPTAFGLSVHNAIGAQHSIARGDRADHVAVAAGAASAGAAMVEAAALLADGADEVMVVCYDAPLPGAYAVFDDEPACRYAWAWRVTRPAATSWVEVTLDMAEEADDAREDAPPAALPWGLDLLRFALSEAPQWRRRAGARRWTWRRGG